MLLSLKRKLTKETLEHFPRSLFSLWKFSTGGDDGIRTHDPLLAGQVLSQLSYTPMLNAKCKVHNAKWFVVISDFLFIESFFAYLSFQRK